MPSRTTTTCRSYSEDRTSGKTFTVASVGKASASIGSRIHPQNAPPCALLFSESFATTTRRSKATTKPPPRIHLISFDRPPGRGHLSSPGLQCSQDRPSLAARSPRSSTYPRQDTRPDSQRRTRRRGGAKCSPQIHHHVSKLSPHIYMDSGRACFLRPIHQGPYFRSSSALSVVRTHEVDLAASK